MDVSVLIPGQQLEVDLNATSGFSIIHFSLPDAKVTHRYAIEE